MDQTATATATAASEHEPQHCGICGSEDTNAENPIVETSCHHSYHYQCILSWFRENSTNRECPYCRSTYSYIPAPEGQVPVPGFNIGFMSLGSSEDEDGFDDDDDADSIPYDTKDKCLWSPSNMYLYEEDFLQWNSVDHPGCCYKQGILSLSKMCVNHYRKTVMKVYDNYIKTETTSLLNDCLASYAQCLATHKNGKKCTSKPIVQSGAFCLCRKHLLQTPFMTPNKYIALIMKNHKCMHFDRCGKKCLNKTHIASGELMYCRTHLYQYLEKDVREQYSHWLSLRFGKITAYYDSFKPKKCKGVDKDGNPCNRNAHDLFEGYCSYKHMNPQNTQIIPKKPLCATFNPYTGEYCKNVVHGKEICCLMHIQQYQAEDATGVGVIQEDGTVIPPLQPPPIPALGGMCLVVDCNNETYNKKIYCLMHINQFNAEDDAVYSAAYGPDY